MSACRNMDIIGVPGVTAEAELLAAIALFLERVGLSAADIVIKVSSRKVLQVKHLQDACLRCLTSQHRILSKC